MAWGHVWLLAFVQASYVLLRNSVDQSQQYYWISMPQLDRPSDSTVRGHVSVIRQFGNQSPPTHGKLNLTLVIAKVNILPCHFDYVKVWGTEMLSVETIFNRKAAYILHEGELLAVSRNSFRFSMKSYMGISLPNRHDPQGMFQSQGFWISGKIF